MREKEFYKLKMLEVIKKKEREILGLRERRPKYFFLFLFKGIRSALEKRKEKRAS